MQLRCGPEEKVILLLARLSLAKENEGAINHLLATVDYERLISLGHANGVASLLYKNLADITSVPDSFRSRVRNSYLQTIRSNLRMSAETLRVIRLLKESGIASIPLKGAIASEMLFGDVGLYPSSDIDLLVRLSDLDEVSRILAIDGYTLNVENREDLLVGHYHLTFSKGRHFVEVHWNLVKRYFRALPEFWWENVRQTEYDGQKILQLSPEKYVLYAIFRLFDHGFRPLKFFVFIAALLEKYGSEFDYNKIVASAAALKMKRVTLFTLRFLCDMLGLDRAALSSEQQIWGYVAFRGSILKGLFQAGTNVHLQMLFYMLLLDSPADVVKVLLRRIFPDLSEIRLRYGLPAKSKLVYIYYLLNPILLATKKRERH